MSKSQNEKKVTVKVLRPWMHGRHIIPISQGEGDAVKQVVVELPESIAGELIKDKKAELSAEKPNFNLPKKS